MSPDSFEYKFDKLQYDLDINPGDSIPLVYRNEFDASKIINFLPQIIVLVVAGFVLRGMMKQMGAMGGKGKSGGVGLFDKLNKTVTLVHPKDIDVRFK